MAYHKLSSSEKTILETLPMRLAESLSSRLHCWLLNAISDKEFGKPNLDRKQVVAWGVIP